MRVLNQQRDQQHDTHEFIFLKIVHLKFLKKIAVSALMCLSASALLAEVMTATRDTELKDDHYLDANTIDKVDFGASVESLKFESGWVQVKVKGKTGWVRAMALKGSGSAEIASVAKVESGRSGQKNVMSTTGVRSLSKASRHALIIGIGQYADPKIQSLIGVPNDLESAKIIATNMSIPEENIHFLKDKNATSSAIENEINELQSRVKPGDSVFIYYSGHGTRWPNSQEQNTSCTEGLLASDGQALSNHQISNLLNPIAKKTDKLLVFYDACHSGGIVNQPFKTRSLLSNESTLSPKFSPIGSIEFCSIPSNMKTRSLSGELKKEGAMPENVVFIAASRPDEVSFDDSKKGGLATTAWRDCLVKDAKDLDQSGSISVDEITFCAQEKIDKSLSKYPDILGQKMTIGGNKDFVPSFFNQNSHDADTVQVGLNSGNSEVPNPGEIKPIQIESNKISGTEQNNSNTVTTDNRKQETLSLAKINSEQAQKVTAGTNSESTASLPSNASVASNTISAEPSLPNPSKKAITPEEILQQIYHQRDSNRDLNVKLNLTSLRINRDPMQFTVESPTDGYLYIALAGSDQKSLYLIYPNELDTNNFITANQPISLPKPKWKITAGGPKGTDTLLFMVTDSPRDISKLPTEKEGPFLKSLLTKDGKNELQNLLNNSENIDQKECQIGGKKRNLAVSRVCSDAFSASLKTIEEK